MARRRLNTILATTTLAAGLSVAPAWAQSLEDTSDPAEAAVEDTTAAVEEAAGTVEGTDAATEAGDDGEPGGTEGASTDGGEAPVSTDDGEDPPVSTDLEADVGPEDEDGSPQLEVDGGVTVDDHTIDVGSTTDPIEDVVDPDPGPSDPDETPPGDGQDSTDGSGSDGVLGGGAVTAAGDDPRSAGSGSGSANRDGNPSSSVMGESVAALAAENRKSDRDRGSTARSQSDTATEPPRGADSQSERFPRSTVDEPSVLATPATTGDSSSPMAALLKSLAALMILGTGVVLKRTLDDPA